MRFSLSFSFILTPISHLLGFLYYWCMNLGLKMSKYKKLRLHKKVVLHRYRTGTGTIPVLVSGTGTTLDGTGTVLLLYRWYRYHPVLVPVPVAEIAQ